MRLLAVWVCLWSVSAYAALSAPIGRGPVGETFTDTPTLRWDVVAGADWYDIWADDWTGAVNVLDVHNVTENAYTVPAALTVGHTYNWVVIAKTASEASAWSAQHVFTVLTSSGPSLATPTLRSPSGEVFNVCPVLRWSPVAGADVYDVYVHDVTIDNDVYFLEGLQVSSWVVPAPLTVAHSYFWYCRARSNSGEVSEWSPQKDFQVAVDAGGGDVAGVRDAIDALAVKADAGLFFIQAGVLGVGILFGMLSWWMASQAMVEKEF